MARTPFELKGKTVFVAGHRGMVGSALVRRLAQEDVELLTADPRAKSICAIRLRSTNGSPPNARRSCFMAAAKVGGIVANNTLRAEFIYDNLAIATECDPRRACQCHREADVLRLLLHLSETGAAAAARRLRC